MMYKTATPDSWNMGEQFSQMLKLAHGGLRGHDRSMFIKRASHAFADIIDNIKFASDETPVHLIAMGATEAYGPNRNGDGFKMEALRKYAQTFVTGAKNYRNHKNKDPKKAYGQVKAAHVNEDMKRVELLVTFWNSKEAADKRGELYAGDPVLEKVAKGEDIPWSMACRVPYDICSSCFNKAASRADYCTEDSCVSPDGLRRGGCRSNITKVAFDGHQMHVDNDRPDFIDISHLIIGDRMNGRPADRIAYGSMASYMNKAANGEVLGGAALAEAYDLWGSTPTGQTEKLAHLAEILAEYETLPRTAKTAALAGAFHNDVQDTFMPLPYGVKASAWAALAQEHVMPGVRQFLEWELGSSEKAAAAAPGVASALPGIYNRLIKSGKLNQLLPGNPYLPSKELPSLAHRNWAKTAAAGYSLSSSSVEQRMMRSVLRQLPPPRVKEASTVSADLVPHKGYSDLADRYAMFKLAILAEMPGLRATDTADSLCELAILQNCIS